MPESVAIAGDLAPITQAVPNIANDATGLFTNFDLGPAASSPIMDPAFSIPTANNPNPGYSSTAGREGVWSNEGGQRFLTGGINAGGLGASYLSSSSSITPLQGGVSTTGLQGGVSTTGLQGGVSQNAGPLLIGGISTNAGGFQGVQEPPKNPPPIFTTQVTKIDVTNNVIQPAEPCRSVPQLKLVFRPKDTLQKTNRELRRETVIPFPQKQMMTIQQFKNQFNGKVFIQNPGYLIRWKQNLPVVVTPQDTGSLSYESADIYDFRTRFQTNSSNVLQYIYISELPVTQVTKLEDVEGGSLDLDDYELELDEVIFADVNQATGKLFVKDPVEAGLFTG